MSDEEIIRKVKGEIRRDIRNNNCKECIEHINYCEKHKKLFNQLVIKKSKQEVVDWLYEIVDTKGEEDFVIWFRAMGKEKFLDYIEGEIKKLEGDKE